DAVSGVDRACTMPPPPIPPSRAEWSIPPAVGRAAPLPVLLLPAKYVIGFFFTSFCLIVLAPLVPLFLLVRFVIYVHDKLVLPRTCDVLWPRPPFTRSFLWVNNDVSLNSIKAILRRVPPPPQRCCFTPTVLAQVEVLDWDHQKSALRTHDDLVTYVKDKMDHVPYDVEVRIVTGCEINSLGKTLLAVKTHPDSFPLCMTRILCELSQGNITIEMEPRVYYECPLSPSARFYKFRRHADNVLKKIEVFCFGPLFLLSLPRFSPEKVWRALLADKDQVLSYRRASLNGNDDSETSQLCIASSVQLKQETSVSFSITEICDVDELQKAERLLRATMAELLTSFLAGALRRYFRESEPAILHPPDCSAAFAVCSEKLSTCSHSHPCDHLLLPIQLPLGVEGRIPRLWSLQRQFALHDENCVPQALKTFNSVVRFLLPRKKANSVAHFFFKHSVLNVSFMRIHGDIMMDSSLLTRFIPIPPLSLPSRASFVFVQQKDKILLVSSIDRGLFERHDDIFKYMKDEQKGLLEHFSFRLRTLTQTCVLPERLPSEDAAPLPAPLDAPHNAPNAERVGLLAGPSRNRRKSMADLNVLLQQVQSELDEMRKNPSVDDRDATIQRLRDLETKIEEFHNGMKSELWGNTVWVRQEKDEAMKRVAELLAPYQRRVSVSGRKLSVKATKEYEFLRRASATTEVSMGRGSGEKKEKESRSGAERATSEEEIDEEKREEKEENEERVMEEKEEEGKNEEMKGEETKKEGEKKEEERKEGDE
ncbi:hypothetical protein PMAYCL1PPCAC_12019, partial [Pristionchus mayeri]